MKINKQNNKKSRLPILSVLFFLVLASATAYYLLIIKKSSNESSNPVDIVQHKSETGKSSAQDLKARSTNSNSEDVDTTKTTDQIPASKLASVTISSLSQNGGTISYEANVTGVESGTCSASFTSKIGKPVVRAVKLEGGVCKDSVNETLFDAIGEWTLELSAYSSNTRATASKSITIN